MRSLLALLALIPLSGCATTSEGRAVQVGGVSVAASTVGTSMLVGTGIATGAGLWAVYKDAPTVHGEAESRLEGEIPGLIATGVIGAAFLGAGLFGLRHAGALIDEGMLADDKERAARRARELREEVRAADDGTPKVPEPSDLSEGWPTPH